MGQGLGGQLPVCGVAVCGVRHEDGLFGDDRCIQSETRPLEEGTGSNMDSGMTTERGFADYM